METQNDKPLDLVKNRLINVKKKVKKSKQYWRDCSLINYRYSVSSHGKIKFKNDLGQEKLVETYLKGQHTFVSLYDTNMVKQEFMLAELILFVFRPENYHFGARIKFRDNNCRNIHIDNLRFKIRTVPICEDSNLTTNWKCTAKAGSANERYKEKTREKITGDEVAAQLIKQGFYCYYCGIDLDNETWQLDHETPVSKGGHNNKNNVVCACKDCNYAKNYLDANQFYRAVERMAMGMGIIQFHSQEATVEEGE